MKFVVGPSTHVPESQCPHCKCKLDETAGIGNDDKPDPGNPTLCIYCGNWMVFGPDLKLRKPDRHELAAIKADRNSQIIYHAAMKLIRKHARQN